MKTVKRYLKGKSVQMPAPPIAGPLRCCNTCRYLRKVPMHMYPDQELFDFMFCGYNPKLRLNDVTDIPTPINNPEIHVCGNHCTGYEFPIEKKLPV